MARVPEPLPATCAPMNERAGQPLQAGFGGIPDTNDC